MCSDNKIEEIDIKERNLFMQNYLLIQLKNQFLYVKSKLEFCVMQ